MIKLLCFVGWHTWSAFIHVPSRCVDEKFCKGCQKTDAVRRHKWSKWLFTTQKVNAYVDGEIKVTGEYSVQMRECTDCNFRQYEEAHA
jgi:hypothetical protein